MGLTKRYLGELQEQAANGDTAVQAKLAAIGLWSSPEELAEREAAENYYADAPLPRFSPDETEDIPLIGDGESFDPETGFPLDDFEEDDLGPTGAAGQEDVYVCANCGTEHTAEELQPCQDFWQRVEPGETIPNGDCPLCGAFCYPKEVSGDGFPLDSSADGEALASAGFGTDEDYGCFSGDDFGEIGDDLF